MCLSVNALWVARNGRERKNKNYLYLAQKLGAQVMAETEVKTVLPAGRDDGSQGYWVEVREISASS